MIWVVFVFLLKGEIMKIKLLPEEERPVEKCLSHGISSLANRELLALLINSGTKDKSAMEVAEEVLAKDKAGISFLREASVEELISIDGIGKTKATRIVAAVELGKRVASKTICSGMHVQDDKDVASLFMEKLRYQKKEFFEVLLLNSKGAVISIETISVGELNSTIVHPREAFASAVKKSAAAIIFIHNHQSGDPTPSEDDFVTTSRLVECGRLLGIRVADHLVIGDGKYVSMRAIGKI